MVVIKLNDGNQSTSGGLRHPVHPCATSGQIAHYAFRSWKTFTRRRAPMCSQVSLDCSTIRSIRAPSVA